MSEKALCKLCGEPMPQGEEVFMYHGASGRCPKPPLQKTIKKEFITYWSIESVVPPHGMTIDQTRFFDILHDEGGRRSCHAILPDKISFNELYVFTGRKTRVTIEILE